MRATGCASGRAAFGRPALRNRLGFEGSPTAGRTGRGGRSDAAVRGRARPGRDEHSPRRTRSAPATVRNSGDSALRRTEHRARRVGSAEPSSSGSAVRVSSAGRADCQSERAGNTPAGNVRPPESGSAKWRARAVSLTGDRGMNWWRGQCRLDWGRPTPRKTPQSKDARAARAPRFPWRRERFVQPGMLGVGPALSSGSGATGLAAGREKGEVPLAS